MVNEKNTSRKISKKNIKREREKKMRVNRESHRMKRELYKCNVRGYKKYPNMRIWHAK